MDATGPISVKQAQELGRAIACDPSGVIRISGHALKRMKERNVSEADIRNTLRFGRASENGMENGTWRFRFETNKFRVVVAFRSETTVAVVTVVRFDLN